VTAPLWYVLGFAFAGFTFVFMTIGMAWLISHRHKGDRHKGLPYESGIDTYGDTHARFGLSFYLYALLFVAFDIEVIFIALWALIFTESVNNPAVSAAVPFFSMLGFVLVMELSVLYAARKGMLSWK
jgi:NADH:ubiquinone oxidoreductase subunit 3 (subunit A)